MTVDAHQHFWKYQPKRDTWITPEMEAIRRDFLPGDLENILKDNRVEATIAVQADQSEKETDFLIKCSQTHPFVKGIVGWTDLQSPHVQARLEYYFQFDQVKGFRHVAQSEPDNFLLSSAFCNGVSLLEQYDFTYDILIYPRHLASALAFVRKFPRQQFVIDHLAKPGIKSQETEPWKKQIMEIAKCENVHCKISGMVTEGDWRRWRPADFRPYVETVLEAFTPKRLMYGSDWPVCLVATDYKGQLDLTRNFIESLSLSEKKAIMGANATRFYHLTSSPLQGGRGN
jgi:L-fuconolactonase